MEYKFCKDCPMKGPAPYNECERILLLNSKNIHNIPYKCPHFEDLCAVFYLKELLTESRQIIEALENQIEHKDWEINYFRNKCGKQNKLIKKLSTRLHDCRKENKELKEYISAQGGSINDVNKYFKNKWR